MKKILSFLVVAALVLSVGVTSAFAASEPQQGNFTDVNSDGVCDVCSAADADGDGVCDNCTNGGVRPQDGTGKRAGQSNTASETGLVYAGGGTFNCGARPQDGTGKRAGQGNANGEGGFTDADGDGVCDNSANGGVRPQDGTGKRAGQGNANGEGGFTDADGDGVCDNSTGARRGKGRN